MIGVGRDDEERAHGVLSDVAHYRWRAVSMAPATTV